MLRTIRVILLGESACGKTAIIQRWVHDTYHPSSQSTIGCECAVKGVYIDGSRYKIQIFDTAGMERFRTIVRSFYRNSDVILLCHDLSSFESYKRLEYYMGVLDELEMKDSPDIQIAIVGTKSDALGAMYQPYYERVYCYYDHYEVSARTNTGIVEMFRDILGKYLEKTRAPFDDVALHPIHSAHSIHSAQSVHLIQSVHSIQSVEPSKETKWGQCCVIG